MAQSLEVGPSLPSQDGAQYMTHKTTVLDKGSYGRMEFDVGLGKGSGKETNGTRNSRKVLNQSASSWEVICGFLEPKLGLGIVATIDIPRTSLLTSHEPPGGTYEPYTPVSSLDLGKPGDV